MLFFDSSGGRFDPGMLYFSPQIWCSDNTDAIARYSSGFDFYYKFICILIDFYIFLFRMRIQYGTSLVYPSRCIGTHVSTVPNHITGNYTRLRTRGLVAMCGTYGFELDICELSLSELNLYKEQIVVYKTLVSPITRSGDLYRLWDPFKVSMFLPMHGLYQDNNYILYISHHIV